MITLSPIFEPIQTTDKRYIVVTGGRGSSKSFSINTLLCLLTYIKGHLILFLRWTLTSAEISIIPEFLEKIELLEVPQDFKTRETSVTNLKTDTSILFRGIKTSSGNQTANLKSIQGVTTLVIEEAEEVKNEEDFDKIDLSVRSNKGINRVILILNPTTKDHWIYRRWFEGHLAYREIDGERIAISTHPDILHIHTTYLDNLDNLPTDYVEQLRAVKYKNPQKYKHVILGGWLEKAEGVVFEDWGEGEFDNSLPYCYGLDFGFYPDPLAMTKVAVDKRRMRIYLKEELYDLKLRTGQVVEKVSSKVGKRNDLIVTDTNEPRTTQELDASGLNVCKAEKGGGSIIEDLKDMMDYAIIVDPSSQNLKKELNNYVWNDKKASIPVDEHNHLIDAARYAFRRLVSGKRRGVTINDFSAYR